MSYYYVVAVVFNDQSVKFTATYVASSTAITFYNDELTSNFATTRTLTALTNKWTLHPSCSYTYVADMTETQQTNLALYAPNADYYAVLTVQNTTRVNDNIIIGSGSGGQIAATIGNTIIGSEAGQTVSTLGPITAVGYRAGRIATRPNTIVGFNGGIGITSGSSNLCIGNGVASSLATGSTNVLLGEGVAIGYTGSNTVCIGSATTRCGTSAGTNVIIGCGTTGFSLTTGSANVLLGNGVGFALTSGGSNVLVGASAGASLSTGTNCIAIGSGARCGSTASGNVCVGRNAATNLTTGATNVFMGDSVGGTCTVGTNNVCIGSGARCGSTSSGSNVCIGKGAGTGLTSGNNNIIVGTDAGSSISSRDNCIIIGASGHDLDSRSIQIGSSTQTSCYIAGISGVSVSGSSAVYIKSNGQLGTVQSSRTYKKDITKIDGGLVNSLERMDVVSFRYKNEPEDAPLSYGMIAEDVAEIDPNLIIYGQEGEIQSIKYNNIIPLLVAYVQRLEERIGVLEGRR
jgi:hypothetical protein